MHAKQFKLARVSQENANSRGKSSRAYSLWIENSVSRNISVTRGGDGGCAQWPAWGVGRKKEKGKEQEREKKAPVKHQGIRRTIGWDFDEGGSSAGGGWSTRVSRERIKCACGLLELWSSAGTGSSGPTLTCEWWRRGMEREQEKK